MHSAVAVNIMYFSRSCSKGFSCRKSGCGKKHHFLLHPPDREETDDRVVEQESANQQPVIRGQSSVGRTAATLTESNHPPVIESSTFAVSRDSAPREASTSSRPRVCFKVVPVRVSGPGGNKQLTTYAFLDSRSDTTLCLESLVEELSLEREPTDFTLSTVNYEGKERGHQARLDIEALDGKTKFTLDRVLTMESLPIGERHFANNRELTKWPHLDGVSLPEIERAELHHFADASEGHGYGTVTYLRFVNKEGSIHNSFPMGKSRVRPLRSGISVTKMELTAATLLIKMDKLIMRELEGRIKIHSVTFWTDSMIVLRYIFNETKRFVTFVANRVAVIREGSRPSQWRHVRSEANPADLASRGIKASETKKLKVWKHGPDFLWKDQKEWPQQPADLHQELSDQDEGVRKRRSPLMHVPRKKTSGALYLEDSQHGRS